MRRVNALDLETGICGFTSNNPPPQKKIQGCYMHWIYLHTNYFQEWQEIFTWTIYGVMLCPEPIIICALN